MFRFSSQPMAKIDSVVERVAPTDLGVLITGESGVGKEVVARKIHVESLRSADPFVKINSAAIPDNLVESELFGHQRGAFTGANNDRRGRVHSAHRGTLFFDEIAELNVDSQTKLLHMIQDKEFVPLGSNQPIVVDVRIVAATNRDLAREVAQGGFREDLFYRLNVVNIHIPPLRECKRDIPGLTDYFLDRYVEEFGRKGVPALKNEQSRLMKTYDWPGNVRELENFVKRLVLVKNWRPTFDDLKERIRSNSANNNHHDGNSDERLSLLEMTRRVEREVERRIITRVLQKHGWNRKITAQMLQISYRSLLDKIKKLEIE